MNTRSFKFKPAVAFFSLVILLAYSLLAASYLQAAPKEIGKVILATQGVTAKQANAPVRSLKRGSPIFLGDTLSTPKGGKAQLRLDDGELLALTEASQISFEDFNFEPTNPKANSSVKHLVTGGLRSITGAVKDEGYQVKTQTGTIGIRGTSFEAFTQNGRNLFVNTHRGDVVVSNANGSLEIGVNKRQRAARISAPGQKPQAISPSQLPQQMQQAFSQDPTLALATEDEANTSPANATGGYQPSEPASIREHQPVVTSTQQDRGYLTELSSRQEQDEKTSDTDLSKMEGFLIGDAVGAYVRKLSFTGDGSALSMTSIGEPDNSFDFGFTGSLTPTEPFSTSIRKNSNSFSANRNSNDNELIDIWTSITLGDAVAIAGIATTDIANTEYIGYAFSNKVLAENKLPTSSTANYSMVFHTAINSGDVNVSLTSGSLAVNFNTRDIDIALTGTAVFGTGGDSEIFTIKNLVPSKIGDFYNSIDLGSDVAGMDHYSGKITGRFVGSNADGAIAAYKLNDPANSSGTIVFKKQ